MEKTRLNHFDSLGNALMADVSQKNTTAREALAKGRIRMKGETLDIIKHGSAKKGDVLGVARIAGIMAAKKAGELIPLCHPLGLDTCKIDFALIDDTNEVEAACSVKCTGRTGVEMEALTGVSVALLTIYDMCKAVDRGMEIHSVRLWEKSGGKSGVYKYEG